MKRYRRILLLCLFVLTACAGDGSSVLPPTPTAYRVDAQSAAQQPDADADDCLPIGGSASAQHTVSAAIDYAAQTAQVQQQVRWSNSTGTPIDTLVLSVEANREPRDFRLDAISLAGAPAVYTLSGRRLTIELPQPIQPGCAVTAVLDFRLNIPPVRNGVRAFRGFFGHTDRQMNLGNWLPVIAARVNGDWLVHDVVFVGEQVVSDPADWVAVLTVTNAPDGLILAAPGAVDGTAPTWRIVHTNARDLTVSLSDQFVVQSRRAGDVEVELYTFSDTLVETDAGIVDAAAAALSAAAESLALYADLFGAYPYSRFVVVEGDFPDGMEFSDIVFVSRDWFTRYNGTPQSYLTIITVHEVAHQWWFARVGSDQALHPWLDEALATYSEYLYYEEFYPDLREWWWTFRVEAFVPPNSAVAGPVDSSVFTFGSIREYINAVYLRGARMLHQLRQDVGVEAFFDWLTRYAEAGTDRIASPDLFWSLLTPDQLAQTAETRGRYLAHPDG